jgi:uncharacterized repeat protein (TIGR03803 family)
MTRNRNFGALGAALLVVVMASLVGAPGMWAQSTYKVLYKFTGGADGSQAFAGLIFDQAGNLYGTTGAGGANGGGTVFKLAPNSHGTWTETVLYSFCALTNCSDGMFPRSSLIFDAAGNLYGTTFDRSGTVFKLTPNADGSWTESVLYSFCSLTKCSDGSNPGPALIFDQAGNLYGTTVMGGATGVGTVFKLTPNADGSWTESVLYSLCTLKKCRDGENPAAALIFDKAGNLYGTTVSGGGAHDQGGAVFQLSPRPDGSWKETVLHSFSSVGGGNFPRATLIFDAAGDLYGTTFEGNASDPAGTVFQLRPSSGGSWKEKVLHQFGDGKYGGGPIANLIFDAAGNLYGTTSYGDDFSRCNLGCGVVFRLKPNLSGSGWHETLLWAFANHPGARPWAGVIFDAAGNIYGTTSGDGDSTFGSVFEITP